MTRKTLAGSIKVQGEGLHTGQPAQLTMSPAESGQGIRFVRVDIDIDKYVMADASYVGDTQRSTTLAKGEIEVKCTEHLLSALTGMGITDALIEIHGPEVPIFDGSARRFVEEIEQVGLADIEGDIDAIVIEKTETLTIGTSTYTLMPDPHQHITVTIDFESDTLVPQYAVYDHETDYARDIAPSRTFVFVHEISALAERGLIKGGALANAIVIADQRSDEAMVRTVADEMEVAHTRTSGIINSDILAHQNEPARHKLLDLIGDLTLVGRPIQGRLIAHKPGHQNNVELAKHIKKIGIQQRKLKGKPDYDPSAQPILDIEQVKAMLPHRYPFLMVDKVIQLTESLVVGIKNVTSNEALFQGHFPGNPVFPGVMQMEALAQTGGILALSAVEEPHLWDTYFLKMDQVKFKAMVRPGDTLILKMELLSPIRRGIVQMQGTAYVGDKIVSEGELIAQIIKRDE